MAGVHWGVGLYVDQLPMLSIIDLLVFFFIKKIFFKFNK